MEEGTESISTAGHFMFVNKNASNVTSRSTKEAYSINSHVQRRLNTPGRGRYRRTSESSKLHRSSSPGLNSAKSNDLGLGRHKWRISSSPTRSRKHSDRSPTPASEDSKYEVESPQEVKLRPILPSTPDLAPARENAVFAPSPSTILKKGNSDPFNATPIPISARANEVLQHARQVGGFMIWPAESILKAQSPIIRAWWGEVAECINDVGTLQSFLTYASTLQATVHEAARPGLMSQALAFKAKSLAYLRNRMTNQPLDWRTFAMSVHLFGAEFYSLDFIAAMTHLKAAKQITDALGGLMSLPQVSRELLLTSDVILASICLSRPLFNVEEWDPGSVDDAISRTPIASRDPDICRLAAKLRSQSQHRVALDDSVRSPRLRSIFRSIRELFDVEDHKALVAAAGSIADDKVFRWVHLRKLACQSRSLNYYIDLAIPVDTCDALSPPERRNSITDHHYVEACLCVAAIYAEGIVFGHPSLPSAHRRLSGLLQKSVVACSKRLGEDDLAGQEYGKAILWALAMGAIEEEKYKWKEPPRSWHSAMFALVMQRLGLEGYEEVKDVMQEFLYCERVQDGPLKELMGKVDQLLLEASLMEPFS